MDGAVLGVAENLIDPDKNPAIDTPIPDDQHSVLAKSLQRVADSGQDPRQDTVAAFQNYV